MSIKRAVSARSRLPVLLYHHVGPAARGGRRPLSIDPARFERHIAWLKRRRFVTVTPSAWISGVRPPRAVMITFDDGYVDIGRHALPLLARCGMTATVFVVMGSLGGEDEWNDELGGDRLRLLNGTEIADWAAQGIEFGAHGRTHRDLTLLDADELASEVQGSRSDLADLLGAPPHAFAYPFGSHDRRVIEVVRKTFSLAFTTNEGLHREGGDPLRVPRVPVLSRDGTTDLFLDVTFGSSVLNHLKRRLFLGKRRIVTRSKSLFRRRTMGRPS